MIVRVVSSVLDKLICGHVDSPRVSDTLLLSRTLARLTAIVALSLS